MATIALLGTGLLGTGFGERLLADGHSLRVYNRTSAKCLPLVEQGAVAADTPADAVRGVDRVHLVLAEDAVVDLVIDALLPGLTAGTPIYDHSTNLPAGVAARAARLAAMGVSYLHAPVFMAPAHARSATGMMLMSGSDALLVAAQRDLSAMTGQLLPLGSAPEAAAAAKLAGNGLLISLTGTLGDLFRVASAGGLSPQALLAMFGAFNPSPAQLGARVLNAGDAPASFELKMARKDIRLMIEAAGGPEGLSVLPGLAAAMDVSLANGHAADDYAIFARP